MIQTSSIDEREEEIAKLRRSPLRIVLLKLGAKLVNLLVYLRPHVLAHLPVKSYAASLVLNTVSLDERG